MGLYGLLIERGERQCQRDGAVDLLRDALLVFDETRAQAVMAAHQRLKAGLQRSDVQGAAQAQGAGDVIGAGLAVELPEEPLTLLGERQRQAVERFTYLRDRQAGHRQAFLAHLQQVLPALFQRQQDKALGNSRSGSAVHQCSSISSSQASRVSSLFSSTAVVVVSR
ncbi:hypothetical protein D3C79_711090 [compost metagenome]